MPYQPRAFTKEIAWVLLGIIGGAIAFLLLQFCNDVDLTYRLGVYGNNSKFVFIGFLPPGSILSEFFKERKPPTNLPFLLGPCFFG